ncbi:MAG: hypothetical protein JWN34_1156 [Bryobacterales bacterium]|nr:hypothetical protein [Bryobacterales bacterium]
MPSKKKSKRALISDAVATYREEFRHEIEFEDQIWNDPDDLEADSPPSGYLNDVYAIPAPEPMEGAPPRKTSGLERDLRILQCHLRRCAEIPNPIVYSFVLQEFLERHNIRPPKGVFTTNHFGPGPGRPAKHEERLLAILAYQRCGSYGKAAKELYPDDYRRDRKAATDRVRLAIAAIDGLNGESSSGEEN